MLTGFNRHSRTNRSWAKRTIGHVLLRLEALEDRMLPSVVPGNSLHHAYVRYTDGQVWEDAPGSYHRIDINSTAISGNFTLISGEPAAFILYNNAKLYEWTESHGFRFIDVNVVALAGSQVHPETVFIIYNNAQLYEWSADAGFRFIDNNVASVSAGGSHVNFEAAAFLVHTNSTLSEWTPEDGLRSIDVNVRSISSYGESDTVDIVYTNNYLYQWSAGTFRFIDVNVKQASSGSTLGNSAIYILYTTGQAYEWIKGDTPFFRFIDNGVLSITAEGIPDSAFLIYPGAVLYEWGNPGTADRPGFHFIDGNVLP
jgi:hypothetical protein